MPATGEDLHTPAQIKRLRTRYEASHAVFAAYLNTSPLDCAKVGAGPEETERPVIETAESGRCPWPGCTGLIASHSHYELQMRSANIQSAVGMRPYS